eukprot:9407081-Pyramimonas_sp.AAC.1
MMRKRRWWLAANEGEGEDDDDDKDERLDSVEEGKVHRGQEKWEDTPSPDVMGKRFASCVCRPPGHQNAFWHRHRAFWSMQLSRVSCIPVPATLRLGWKRIPLRKLGKACPNSIPPSPLSLPLILSLALLLTANRARTYLGAVPVQVALRSHDRAAKARCRMGRHRSGRTPEGRAPASRQVALTPNARLHTSGPQ